MTHLKSIFILINLVWFSGVCLADSIRISQIDSRTLLLNQQITLYLSITDNKGIPVPGLKQDNFKILESPNNRQFKPVDQITGFQFGLDDAKGLNFLLLIDNSESMYWTLEGKRTQKTGEMRITAAKKAVNAFLQSIENPNDKVGIAVYNSYYKLLTAPGKSLDEVGRNLDQIKRPTGDGIYSEIYGSLDLAVNEFELVKGRKAIIILSDGVNNPSYNHTQKINQQFGTKFVSYQKPLDSLQNEGISLYVVNFGQKNDKKDRHLKTIAMHSGGVTFDAYNQRQLKQVYSKIMNQVQKEYVLTYKATLDPSDKKLVRVNYQKDGQKKASIRSYLSSSVFGNPSEQFNPLMLLYTLGSMIFLWFLSRLKFEKQRPKPSIEVLNAGAGKLSTQVLTLGGEETIIGSSPSADMTIAGIPSVEENHATIIFDDATQLYTLKSETKVLVNNQMVTTKALESGDLINIDGATLVFDEGTEKSNEEK